jgi:redox-sensing transcriptional repressor
MPHTQSISDKIIGRLSLYRRMLERGDSSGEPLDHVFSHELASMAGVSAVLVRRDLMTIGFSGNPKKGYNAGELIASIGAFLDAPGGQNACLVGVGNLGRALLAYFIYRRPKLPIVAAFDNDPELAYRVIRGCRCHPIHDMPRIIAQDRIRVGIITVPADSAQLVADQLLRAGVSGLLNFAPVALRVPPSVYVDNIDMTTSLEKVAFFARQQAREKKVAK